MSSDLFYQFSPPSTFVNEPLPGPSLSSPMVPQQQQRRRRQLHKDVVVIGGGLAGLSTALYLTQIDPTRRITIIDRNNDHNNNNDNNDSSSSSSSSKNKNNIPGNMASMAAAGMLAPHSERLPKGDYLDLCLASKRMYIDFVALVEGMAYDSGPEGYKYLWKDDNNNDSTLLEPWNIGYVASGGFLAPAFAGDNVATWMPDHNDDDEEEEDRDDENNNPNKKKKKKTPTAFWLDATQARELEPYLHPDVVGGWWFPEDASVDARRLTCSLKAACIGAGVEFVCGPNNGEVTSLDLQDGVCKGLWIGSRSSRYVSAKAILVANGAWMRNLLPVPLEPHKGQSLSLRMPKDRPPILRRVLFGGDSYIVPKADGRIVIGATVEAGSFDSNVTPAGIMHVLSHALQLVPGLADLPIEETWAGLRPTTPDKGPILGETPWENLFVAGGYWRNGVLLAPKTGHLLATLIASKNNNHDDNEDSNSEIQLSQEDRNMLDAFSWDRFTSPGGGKRMAANSRYAASMYPVHKRQSGTGIAAAVGTELGSYSTARSAREERRIDRESLLFGNGDSSTTATTDNNDNVDNSSYSDDITEDLFEKAALLGMEDAAVFEGFDNKNKRRRRPDNEDEDDEKEKESLEAKRKTRGKTMSTEKNDELDDDDGDDEESLKYYYTQQEAALRRPSQQKDDHDIAQKSPTLEVVESSTDSDSSSTSTSTFDGSADAFTVGSATSSASAGENTTANINSKEELESIYQSIRNNKSKQDVDLPDQTEEKRLDPGFRIYHVDKKTGESRIVPPYTSQAEFFESLEAEEASAVKENESPQGQEEVVVSASASTLSDNTTKDSSGMSFDGYQKIVDANSSDNRQDELNAMKEARRKNRSKGGIPQIQKKQ